MTLEEPILGGDVGEQWTSPLLLVGHSIGAVGSFSRGGAGFQQPPMTYQSLNGIHRDRSVPCTAAAPKP
jgi:hypothetical protein